MAAIAEQLMQKISGEPLKKLSEKLGSDEEKTRSALGSAIPFLLQSMVRKSQEGEEREKIRSQIAEEKEGGFDFSDLAGFFQKESGSEGLLSQLIGGKKDQVTEYIHKDSGMEKSSVVELLQLAAPLLTRFLAKKESENEGDAIHHLQRFDREMLEKDPKSHSVLNRLLDRDNDGDIKDDVADLGKSLFSSFAGKH